MKPLVEIGPELDADALARYSRHLLVPGIGIEGQRRLANASVCVVGAGGLGSPVLLYLAAAGVGSLTVIDHDVVDLSNLQRQVLHRTQDLGEPKALSAARAVVDLNPLIKITPLISELNDDNVVDVLSGHDLVIDGTDNFATRYLVGDTCADLGMPVVWAAVLRFDAQIATFMPEPLVAAEDATSLRDLFPMLPPPEATPSCSDAGVLGMLTGQVGSIMAGEAIKLITGAGEPLVGRVLLLDSASMRMREVPLRPRPVGAVASAPKATSAPERFDAITPAELAAQRDAVTVLDVREPGEHALGLIDGAHAIPLDEVLTWEDLGALPDGPLVVTCKLGPRARRAATHLRSLGHADLSLLSGGMVAWTEEIDPSLIRY